MIHLPEHIQRAAPYVPGKPIEETKRELGLKRVVKLASNENPLGPSPKARAAVARALKESHRYPDASGFRLRQALAKLHDVKPAEIVLGNGSDNLIDLLVRVMGVPGDAIVTSEAAFGAYRVCAQAQGLRTLATPLKSDHTFDLKNMAERAASDPRAVLLFIANPNNPTGTYVGEAELRAFLKRVREIRRERGRSDLFVILDYAYQEYVTARDLPDPLVDGGLRQEFSEFVAVLRTFSKIYGLAGLRVGYGVGPLELMQAVERIRQPFNVSSLGLVAAEAALKDAAFVRRARALNIREMKRWVAFFKKHGLTYLPSQGNFFLVHALQGFGLSGRELFERALRLGVILRPVDNYGLTEWIRISVGTSAENTFAIKALTGLLPRRKA